MANEKNSLPINFILQGNAYKYKMVLLGDVGPVNTGFVTYKTNKGPLEVYEIKSIGRTTLPMPAKVDDLTIDGNGKDFILTGTSISVDSNIVFKNVAIKAVSKTSSKGTFYNNKDGEYYTYTRNYFINQPKLSLSVAKNRTVTFENYRGTDGGIYYEGEYGFRTSTYIMYLGAIGSIKGASGSKLIVDGGTFPVLDKISGIDTLEIKNSGSLWSSYDKTGHGNGSSMNVNNLVITNSFVKYNECYVTAKTTTMDSSYIECGTFTSNELNLTGDASNSIDSRSFIKCPINVKKINVNSAGSYNVIKGRVTAKGQSQITVGAVSYAEGCAGNRINLVLYDYHDRYFATLSNGQIIVNSTAALPVDAFTLVTGADARYGHTCGVHGTDWTLQRGAKDKNLVFKTMAH